MTDSLNYNFFNTLIFSGIIYGFVFCSASLYNKKYYSDALFFLILTVLSMTLSNLQYWLIDIGLREKFEVPKVYYIQFELLILPFYYLFVEKYFGNKVHKGQILILMIPFALGMMYQIIIYSFDIDKSLKMKYNLVVEILTIIYSMALIVLIFRKTIVYEKSSRADVETLDILAVKTKWIKYTLGIGILVFVLWIIGTQLFYIQGLQTFKTYYPLWICISGVIYWIGNKGVVELKVLQDRRRIRSKRILENQNLSFSTKKLNGKGKSLFEKIVKKIIDERAYLNPNLSLQVVSDNHDISGGYLSQLISTYSNDSFADFINKLRIQEAKRMLLDNSFDKYTIGAIALEAGFNTKSNFYMVFKKVTGLTPSQFKRIQNL